MSANAPIPQRQVLEALRKVQFMFTLTTRPLARACGLTQEELATLANGGLIEVTSSSDEGPDLDRYHVERILPEGFSILAHEHVAKPNPLEVVLVPSHKSIYKRVFEATRSGTWDLIKVALGAVLGWYLKKYLP
jgi:hypothetical protein